MSRSGRRLLILATVTFIAGLVVSFPARLAVHWFAPPDVAFAGVSGSIWKGSAGTVASGSFRLDNLNWRLRPSALLSGRLAADVSANPPGGEFSATTSFSAGGTIELRDVNAVLPLETIATAVQMNGASGWLEAQISELRLTDGLPVSAIGVTDVSQLRLPAPVQGELGDFRIEMNNVDDGIVASIEDREAVLDVAGSLHLTNQGEYSLVVQVANTADTPDALDRLISRLPRSDSPGRHIIQLEGSL